MDTELPRLRHPSHAQPVRSLRPCPELVVGRSLPSSGKPSLRASLPHQRAMRPGNGSIYNNLLCKGGDPGPKRRGLLHPGHPSSPIRAQTLADAQS
ncbi:hypothetical protein NDU88_004238 [Pleurodeles waltl]|uniref:Uncharacterized protein n=1 Tax=Pleurodeles waltl TaxID=8319 RepID=A0AAV7VIA3_PLEWA|nr:hypothetical protein NDU88_004238 [Pleurodeles waltl]